jgi:hypothetical protein
LEEQVSTVMLTSALIRSESWAFAWSGKNNDLRAEKPRHSEAPSPKPAAKKKSSSESVILSHSVPVPIFSAPARPLSRVIGGAETGVLLSIITMMISMLNIGKARQL